MSDSTEDDKEMSRGDGQNTPSIGAPCYNLRSRKPYPYEEQEQKEENEEGEEENSSCELKRKNRQPDAFFMPHLKKLKTEGDFNPIFGPKKDPVSEDEDSQLIQSCTLSVETQSDFQQENKNDGFSTPCSSAPLRNRKETVINFLHVPASFYQLPNENEKNSTSTDHKQFLSEVSASKNLAWNDHRDFQIFNSFGIKWSQIERIKSKFNQNEIESEENKEVFSNLLKSCTNLKFLDFPPLGKASYFSSSLLEICTSLNKNDQKKLTISNLSASVADIEDVEKIQKFAETKIRILNWTLWICFSFSRSRRTSTLTRAVEKILESSKNTMTDLNIMDSSDFLYTLKFPQMPQLKSLKLLCAAVSKGNLKFGEGFQLSFNFPGLTDLNLDFSESASFDFHNLNPALSVKKLKLSCDSLPKKMLETFPEIEELELSKVDNQLSSLSFIWEISTKLKKLKLGIPSQNPNPNSLAEFISVLSGFTMETVKHFLDFPRDKTAELSLETLDNMKSLLDLPELESLTFIGSKDAFEEFRSKGLPILRKLTLNLMPDLLLKFHRRSASTISKQQ